jgi:hypothetical protein
MFRALSLPRLAIFPRIDTSHRHHPETPALRPRAPSNHLCRLLLSVAGLLGLQWGFWGLCYYPSAVSSRNLSLAGTMLLCPVPPRARSWVVHYGRAFLAYGVICGGPDLEAAREQPLEHHWQ